MQLAHVAPVCELELASPCSRHTAAICQKLVITNMQLETVYSVRKVSSGLGSAQLIQPYLIALNSRHQLPLEVNEEAAVKYER